MKGKFGRSGVLIAIAGASAGFIVGGAPISAEAFVCKTSDTRPHITLKWPERIIPFGIRVQSELQPEWVLESFERWSAVPCSDLTFRYLGLVQQGDVINQVSVLATGWVESGFSPTAVGITVTEFEPLTGRIVRSDILLNDDRFDFSIDAGTCRVGAFDIRAVLTHEAGHFVGLDHTQFFVGGPDDPTMAPEVQSCEIDKRTLEPDDEAGICTLYPVGAISSGCVGLPEQDRPYVRNRAFGCRAAHAVAGEDSGTAGLWGIVLAALACFARRYATCPPPRSGG